ncbi:MAG: helix-turn-helix domain-containing protein [Lachnospiraceae bacterium]
MNGTVFIVSLCSYSRLALASLLSPLMPFLNIKENPIRYSERDFYILYIPDINNGTHGMAMLNQCLVKNGRNLIVIAPLNLKILIETIYSVPCICNKLDKESVIEYIDDYFISLNCGYQFKEKNLSYMEMRILKLLAKGRTITQISTLLQRNVKTISTHKINIMNKLSLRNCAKSISIISFFLKNDE